MNELSDTCKSVAIHWGLTFKCIRDDLAVAGSPERCLSRMVIEDDGQRLFILEEISPQNMARKEQIAATLALFSHRGLPALHPYLPNAGSSYITKHENRFWILRPYIEGVSLKRPDYVHEGWRGRAMAEFLMELKKRSHGIAVKEGMPVFSITAFIADLLQRINIHNRELLPHIAPIIECLDGKFFAAHDGLPVCFCHGDFHPLNVIWMENGIASVIDWEFCGPKAEIYDLALLTGCIGMEDPAALTGPFVRGLLHGIAHTYAPLSRHYLFEYVVAVRFAWLSEWLRNADREMIALEIEYMTLLVQEQGCLKDTWRT